MGKPSPSETEVVESQPVDPLKDATDHIIEASNLMAKLVSRRLRCLFSEPAEFIDPKEVRQLKGTLACAVNNLVKMKKMLGEDRELMEQNNEDMNINKSVVNLDTRKEES